MTALFVLLGLVVLALPIAVVALIVAHLRLRKEVQALESILAELLAAVAPRPSEQVHRAEDALAVSQTVPQPAPETTPLSDQSTRSDKAQTTQPWARPEPTAPKSPASPPVPQAPLQPPVPSGPKPPSRAALLVSWMQENWFYAAAAVSLALSGIFLVQYGVETGLLTPTARVSAALLFGAALIGAGEMIRRRFGDAEDSTTAYLPSVFSGAGLVSLMGGVLAARLLYDLIAPGPALGALFGISLFGLWLGWRHGPLLAAVGLIGGISAPFLVGGESTSPEWLLGYFGLLAALGLGIDTLRRWAWVSVLSVCLGGAAGILLSLSEPGNETLTAALAVYAVVLVILVVLIPARSLAPDHDGTCITEPILASGDVGVPIFPVLLSAGTLTGACLILSHTALATPLTWSLSLGLAAGLIVLITLWSRGAPALQDQAGLPLMTFVALVAYPEWNAQGLAALTDRLAAQEGLTEQRMPWDITLILLASVTCGLVCTWRSLQPGRFSAVWAGVAVLLAPLTGLALEFAWGASTLLGPWPWGLHALALAALMVAKAARFATADSADRLRPALATISALACLAFALTVLLTDAALTLALATVVVAAAALDRRFNLPQMTGFIAAGIIALGYRLLVDPGIGWGMETQVLEMLAAYGGTLLALLGALWLVRPLSRPRARVFLESAAWSVGGTLVSLTLYHAIEGMVGHAVDGAHWILGLYATIWIGTALAQLERLKIGGALLWLRVALASLFGLLALVALGSALVFVNPLVEEQTVHGPALLNTLVPAYMLPALVLGFGAWRLTHLPRLLRLAMAGGTGVLVVTWIGLAIRHFWQGGTGMYASQGVSEPELYSYTVALLLAGAGLFYQALARRSDGLRRAGVLVIGLAVAKVFLIDISGLAGLVRVFSFLLLGVSLAGLAWLNRWVQTRGTQDTKPE